MCLLEFPSSSQSNESYGQLGNVMGDISGFINHGHHQLSSSGDSNVLWLIMSIWRTPVLQVTYAGCGDGKRSHNVSSGMFILFQGFSIVLE